jgi:hypothetical protein
VTAPEVKSQVGVEVEVEMAEVEVEVKGVLVGRA